MPNGLKKMFDETFGTPAEGIKTLREFTSGETGKQLNLLLAKVERLSKDSSSLPQVLELFKLIERCGQAGYLKDLNGILKNLPRGKSGQTMVTELRKMVDEVVPRLDHLSALARTLMEKE
jgi:hypothetical protein